MHSRRFFSAWLLSLFLIAALPFSIRAQQGVRKIQPNDLLIIRVLGEIDMTKEAKVSSDGKVNYVFIGDVPVGGQTMAEAQEKIRQLLMKDWFVNPQVIIEMRQYAVETVTVLGQVNRPGPVVLPTDRRVDLLEVIGLAGDFSRLARKSQIDLFRKGKKVTFSYEKLKEISDPAKKYFVEPDDIIEVATSVF